MATIVSDTHKLITKLAERGFTRVQAEALTEALQELDMSEIATRQDIKDMQTVFKNDLNEMKYRLTWNFFGLLFAQAAFVIAVIEFFK